MPEYFISIDQAQSDVLACAAYLAERIKSSDGHAEAVAAVVPRYLASNNVDLAAELANSVDDPFTRDRLLMAIAEKCAANDDDEYALQLAEAIEDYGIQAQARERIALQKAAKGEFEKAREIAADMTHPDFIYAAIATKQAANGEDQAAAETLEEIDFVAAKVSALHGIAVAKIASDEPEKAAELIDQAVIAAEEIEHDEERIRIVCELGNFLIDAKRTERATAVFEKALAFAESLDNVHRDSFLAQVSLGFLHAGDFERAESTLDLVADKTQIATALLGYAREFWKKDERDEAFNSLEEAYSILKSQRESETRSSREKFSLFNAIAAQFAGFEKGERAIEIAEEIADETQQMSALGQIAYVLTVQKNDDLARQAIRAIREDSNRVFAIIGVSDVKRKNDEKKHAAALLDEAASLADTLPQPASRSSAYNEIATRYFDSGDLEKAGSTVRRNLETISSIKDESGRSIALTNLSELLERPEFILTDDEKTVLHQLITKAGL